MKKRGRRKSRKGQVWIETVIYTLIAFVMIGLILAFARPKILEIQDQTLLQQSTQMLKQIETTVLSMVGAGNQRVIEIGIKKGELKIDGINDKIIFEMESRNVYSEPGRNVNDGSVIVLTEEKSGYNLVTLTVDYSENYNIKFDNSDELEVVNAASNPYRLFLLNEGEDSNGKIIINVNLE